MSTLITHEVTSFVIDHIETGRGYRTRRKALGVSLRRLAGLIALSPPYVSDLERGRRNWDDHLVLKFEAGLALAEEHRNQLSGK